MRLIVLLELLTILEYGETESIKITSPSSAVELHSDITFTVSDLSLSTHSRWFDRLDCATISPDDPNYKIIVAQYDTNALKFKTPAQGIPQLYRGRVRYSKHYSFVIERIQFTDKLMKVICILNYKTGFETKIVQSSIYQITFVYVNPTFQSGSTKEGTVVFLPESRITIQCIIKGFPESDILWASITSNSAHKSTSSKTPLKNEYTTTSIFTLDSPTVDDNGKTVDCVVVPKIGTGIRRRFALKMYYVNPIFQRESTREGTVMFAPGRRVTIQCVVKGFPESKINWESSIGNFAHSTTSSRTPLKNEYTTTSIFTLDSPTVDDNGKTVDCVVVPKIGTGLRRRFALKMYYVNPIFQRESTKEGTVMFVPGRRVTIQCVVKGFPESKINWESSIGNFAHSTTNAKTPQKNEYTTTSIFTLESPTTGDNGKTVDCVVVPQIGKGLRRRFTLKTNHGDSGGKKSTKKVPTGLIIVLVAMCIIGLIVACIWLNRSGT